MKRLTNLLAITLLTSCVTAFAQEQEETTTEKSAVEQSADIYADGYNKFRFGGYGEILANFMDYGINRFRGTDNGSKKDHRNSISIPRFVLAFDYKFCKGDPGYSAAVPQQHRQRRVRCRNEHLHGTGQPVVK